MKNWSVPRCVLGGLLVAGAALAPSARASEPPLPNQAQVLEMRQRVDVLQQQSRELRHDAEVVYGRESADCRTAVLVNNCLGGAADRRLEKIEQARALEKEINVLGRGIRRFDLAERRAERARRQAERVRQTTVEVDGAAPKLIVPPDLSVVPAGPGKSD